MKSVHWSNLVYIDIDAFCAHLFLKAIMFKAVRDLESIFKNIFFLYCQSSLNIPTFRIQEQSQLFYIKTKYLFLKNHIFMFQTNFIISFGISEELIYLRIC